MLKQTNVSACVIGAGVVGLAVSRALAVRGAEVFIVEKEDGIGKGTSSRNSQVVHAGMYYPKGSLKAKCCVEGRRELYKFCDLHGVEYKKRGKLIVATSAEQVGVLDDILKRSIDNGLNQEHGDGLQMLSGDQANELEPELNCIQALQSPETGVVDGHGFMLAIQGEAENNGALLARNTMVQRIQVSKDLKTKTVETDSMNAEFDIVINCAGLDAIGLAQETSGISETNWCPGAKYAKGNYFKLEGCKTPFQRLIYPVPEEAGLGVHVTIDIGGQARFGPDVEWIKVNNPSEIDYTVDQSRCDSFYDEIRKYWPNLPDKSLVADYSGVRPKTDTDGFQDFAILGPRAHGIPGLFHLVGIESPGLTSSLALANLVANQVFEYEK